MTSVAKQPLYAAEHRGCWSAGEMGDLAAFVSACSRAPGVQALLEPMMRAPARWR